LLFSTGETHGKPPTLGINWPRMIMEGVLSLGPLALFSFNPATCHTIWAYFRCQWRAGQLKDIHNIFRFWNQLSRHGGKMGAPSPGFHQ
jgi:hypothetical protein